MSVTWLFPAALGGLLLAAVPIAIHFLVREQSRRLEFPSLRFLQASRLAAWRQRSIQDAVLLASRILIISAAVAALAAPVFRFTWRDQALRSRVVRAIVIAPGEAAAAAVSLARGPMRTELFARATIADSIADALAWLDDQPSAAREVAVAATFRRGQVASSDFERVPAATGILLARLPAPAVLRDVEFPVLVLRGDGVMRVIRHVHLDDASTSVTDGALTPVSAMPIRVVASAKETRLADAALRAVLTAGVHWPDSTPQLQVKFPAAVPGESAATTLARAIERAVAAAPNVEPVLISDAELSQWSRPPGPPPPGARPADEGDRRWLWAAAIVLMGVEYLLRRTSAGLADRASPTQEARVA